MRESWEAIVDVGSKPVVEREATASGLIIISKDSLEANENGQISKGDVREASTVAAIQAVKDTPRTIPTATQSQLRDAMSHGM